MLHSRSPPPPSPVCPTCPVCSLLFKSTHIRVIEHVYAQLPRSYFDIYPCLPPTRQLVPSPKASKSWHRLYLTMLVWVPYMILQTSKPQGVRGDRIPIVLTQIAAAFAAREINVREPAGLAVYKRSEGHLALGLRRKSRAAIDKYRGTAFFPEQVIDYSPTPWREVFWLFLLCEVRELRYRSGVKWRDL